MQNSFGSPSFNSFRNIALFQNRVGSATTRRAAVAAAVVAACMACGEVAPVGVEQSLDPDTAGTLDDIGGTTDQADSASSSGGGADATSGTGCLSNNDCTGVKGQTPCRVAKCVGAKLVDDIEGKCELEAHPTGTPCIDATIPVNECKQQQCDAAGECKAEPRPNTAACDDPNLTATECQLKLCDGAGSCDLVNVEEGTGCKGAFACGTVCKAGKCIVQTAADYDDSNPCTNDYCKDGASIAHDPIDDLSATCDDGKACTGDEHCAKGECVGKELTCNDGHTCTDDSCDDTTGCVNKVDDTKCLDDGNPCTELGCDAKDGCIAKSFKKDEKCDDGDQCTPIDKCDDKGACLGGESECLCASDKDCEEGNLCLPKKCVEKKCVVDQAALELVKCNTANDTLCGVAVCDPTTGQCSIAPKNDAKECDDNSVCTAKSACKDGACTGEVDKKCDDSNPCTADACDGLKGCVASPAEGTCDDGNKCTADDHCANGGCVGEAKGCDDGVPCTIDSCGEAGDCVHKAENSKCEDNNPCTANTCDAAKKGCTYPADNAAKCDDDNTCTTTECKEGVCTVTKVDKTISGCGCSAAADCKDDNNVCTVQKCTDGTCVYDAAGADGTACDDGNKCNVETSGKCAAGKCGSGKPKDCSSKAGPCTTAFCDAQSGACVVKNNAEGSACQDGDGCTENDKCQEGVCKAGSAVECKDKSVCVATVCAAKSATTHECTAKNKAKDESCDDGDFCTEGEACDGAGKCGGSKPKDCSAAGDACNSGVCDTTTKACAKKPKAAGTACDDGDYCKTDDKCDNAGKCVGGPARVCPSNSAKCQVGSCNAAVSKCLLVSAKDGSGCNDGNSCTQTDVCAKGTCTGGNEKKCASDACNTGVCNTSSGVCDLKPKADKTACSDGNACTTPDLCYTGSCKAGPVTCACTSDGDCNDKNDCTIDKCTGTKPNTKCTNTVSTTNKCSDGNLCTEGDKCTIKGSCYGTAKNCDDKEVCTNDSCSTKSGACVNTANTNSCTDNNACTVGDVCGSGKCQSGKLTNCNDGTKCSTDTCDTKTGSCSYAAVAKEQGLACEKTSSVCVSSKCSCKLYYGYEGSSSSTSNYYSLYDVVPSEYGGSISVGEYVNGSYRYGAVVTRTADGNVTRRSTISGNKSNYVRALYGATSYGTSVFSAVGYQYTGSQYEGWYVDFDKTGLVKNNTVISYSTKNEFLRDVYYTPSYKMHYAVGDTSVDGYQRGLIVRVNPAASNGIGWSTRYGNSSKSTTFQGVASYGGYLYVAGYSTAGGLGGYDGIVVRYKLNSTTLTYNTVKYFGGTSSDYIYDIVAVGSYIYTVGSSYSGAVGLGDAWVQRLSWSTLGVGFDKRYGSTKFDTYRRAAPWGSGIAVSGYFDHQYAKGSFNRMVTMDMIDVYGTQKAHRLYGTTSTVDYGYGIASTGSQGGVSYAISGYTATKGQGLHIQTNEAGTTSCGGKVYIPIGKN